MKKVLLLTAIVGGAIAFTSCSKQTDHTCMCTEVNSFGTDKEPYVFRGISEDEAKTTCTSLNYTNGGTTRTCSLVN